MSRVAPPPQKDVLRRRARRALLIGVACCLPRVVLAWLVLPPAYDLLLIAVTLLFVGGLLAIAIAVFQFVALRTERVLPVAVVGALAVLVAGVVVGMFPAQGAPVAFDGGLIAPVAVVLHQYLYLLLGAMSQLGLMLVVGAVGVAVTRLRTRRA
jgi:hypothetical protein